MCEYHAYTVDISHWYGGNVHSVYYWNMPIWYIFFVLDSYLTLYHTTNNFDMTLT